MISIRNSFALSACSLALLTLSCNPGSSSSISKNESTYTVPDEITLTAWASRDETNGTVINGTTNLPDATKLGVELMSRGRPIVQDFEVVVASGKFHSAGFRKGTAPLPPGKKKVHIFTHFTAVWQSPTVLNLVGTDGSKLKPSAVIHSEDPQLIDGENILDYSADLVIPPLGREAGTPADARKAQAIEIVKKSVLTVDGERSSMDIEDGVQYYFGLPGIRMGDGWSATQTARDSFNVTLDFIDTVDAKDGGPKQELHKKAIWEINVSTKKVLYRTTYAKYFSYIPK